MNRLISVEGYVRAFTYSESLNRKKANEHPRESADESKKEKEEKNVDPPDRSERR